MSLCKLYTIGYTPFAVAEFMTTLKDLGITVLVDVRSVPHSARYPEFDASSIKLHAHEHGLVYLHMGGGLGARPNDPALYTSGVADFKKIAASDGFERACQRIRNGLERYTICLMCAEQDPADCHRAILIAHYFRKLYPDVEISHILAGARVESQQELDYRILSKYGMDQYSFDSTEVQDLDNAYRKREKKIAYTLATEREVDA